MKTVGCAIVWLMVSVACTGNASEGDRLDQAKREQAAARTIQMFGGYVLFEAGSPCLRNTPLSAYEAKSVTQVNLSEEELAMDAPKGLSIKDCTAQLKSFSKLRLLMLGNPSIDDAMLKSLEPLGSLEVLELRGTKVTEEGMKWLRKQFPKCRIVNYDQAKPSPDGQQSEGVPTLRPHSPQGTSTANTDASDRTSGFVPLGAFDCSGASGGIGGFAYSTGFTFVKLSDPKASETKLAVSFASAPPSIDPTKYRVVAVDKQGGRHISEPSGSACGAGQKLGVITLLCTFPLGESEIGELIVEQVKE